MRTLRGETLSLSEWEIPFEITALARDSGPSSKGGQSGRAPAQ